VAPLGSRSFRNCLRLLRSVNSAVSPASRRGCRAFRSRRGRWPPPDAGQAMPGEPRVSACSSRLGQVGGAGYFHGSEAAQLLELLPVMPSSARCRAAAFAAAAIWCQPSSIFPADRPRPDCSAATFSGRAGLVEVEEREPASPAPVRRCGSASVAVQDRVRLDGAREVGPAMAALRRSVDGLHSPPPPPDFARSPRMLWPCRPGERARRSVEQRRHHVDQLDGSWTLTPLGTCPGPTGSGHPDELAVDAPVRETCGRDPGTPRRGRHRTR